MVVGRACFVGLGVCGVVGCLIVLMGLCVSSFVRLVAVGLGWLMIVVTITVLLWGYSCFTFRVWFSIWLRWGLLIRLHFKGDCLMFGCLGLFLCCYGVFVCGVGFVVFDYF